MMNNKIETNVSERDVNLYSSCNFIRVFASSILLLYFAITFTACTLFVKPPTEPVLEQLSPADVYSYNWDDDLNFDGLETAIEQSRLYYKRLSPSYSFHYGDMVYTPGEMEVSMNLFQNIINSYQGKDRIRELREKFLFLESKNSDGNAFFTGYYEPLLEGSLVPTENFTGPLFETPDDLIDVDLGQFADKWRNDNIVGRLEGRRLVPYDSREEIVYQNSLISRARPIAYVNEIELFFLQIQGSGLVMLEDGNLIRVNYAQKNGHPYRAIGKILKDKIPSDQISLQSIKAYLYSHPDEVREILSYNQSYIFFRVVEQGPLGNIEVPLTANRSIAMDRRLIPKGGLAYIETDSPVIENGHIKEWKHIKRFVLVQDTGGAIREHGRVDIFTGTGENAAMVAGHLKNTGRAFVIVAKKEYLK